MTRNSTRKQSAPTQVEEVAVSTESPEVTQVAEVTPGTPEELLARIAELEAALAARPARKAREPKLTTKQRAFLSALVADPSASLSDLVRISGAGGVTEPHGFVYRLVDHGYVSISVPADVVSQFGLDSSPARDEEEATREAIAEHNGEGQAASTESGATAA